jgi:EAL domain-containing protein (putative c-di-GMP-specific phosphodiesterase class I)
MGTDAQETLWHLEGLGDADRMWRVELKPLPFVIGRQPDCHLRLAAPEISRRHAELDMRDGRLWIREFGSTNGTFVNRQRISGSQVLKEGDVLHFGPFELHLIQATASAIGRSENSTMVLRADQVLERVSGEGELNELLLRSAVVAHFQAIVELRGQRIVGYELLGRGAAPGLPVSPAALLRVARRRGKEVELSELFRRVGIEQALTLGMRQALFLNTVPAEMDLLRLGRSLLELRRQAPRLPLVLEVHEAAVTSPELMQGLRALLAEMEIDLAYDDFGVNQARLQELIVVPPDYLKFDRALIRNLRHPPPRARQVLRMLVAMARDLGIRTLAEGVETEEELESCAEIGFDLAQGYYLGRPMPRIDIGADGAQVPQDKVFA